MLGAYWSFYNIQISKVVYKAALFYVEQTLNLHIVLYNVLTQILITG